VSLTTPCTSLNPGGDFIHSSAYLGSYNPSSKCANYLADIGGSPNPSASYSFTVPGSSTFVVIVNETDSNTGCTNYVLNVSGFECPASLSIVRDPGSPANVLLKWSTAAVGYDLMATNALKSPPNAFAPVGPPPIVVGGKYTVTNPASGAARFYELRKP
jgi:hypothetical protein